MTDIRQQGYVQERNTGPVEVQKVSNAEIFGPFATDAEVSELVVDGYKVPYITLIKQQNGSARDQREWTIVLDNRLRARVSEDEIERWGALLAQFGARCAGMTSHGHDSTYLNPHGPSLDQQTQIQQQQRLNRRF